MKTEEFGRYNSALLWHYLLGQDSQDISGSHTVVLTCPIESGFCGKSWNIHVKHLPSNVRKSTIEYRDSLVIKNGNSPVTFKAHKELPDNCIFALQGSL
jgi:hypothetical protein